MQNMADRNIFVALLLLLPPLALGQVTMECPTGEIFMAGADGAQHVIETWRDGFASHCSELSIVSQGGGYPMGAARVCDNHPVYSGVDLGGMEGPFFAPQAQTRNGWEFDCNGSERNAVLVSSLYPWLDLRLRGCYRIMFSLHTFILPNKILRMLQLRVAKEGITVKAATSGAANKCIKILGGLSIDQLRWIFSAYSERQLQNTGWDPVSIPFSDGNDATHLWSELNENCTATEIDIAGPDTGGDAHRFFSEHILRGQDEVLRDMFQSSVIEELDSYVTRNTQAIYFYQLHDMFSLEHMEQRASVASVPIMNKQGEFYDSNAATFEKDHYPLLRDIYLGFDTNPTSTQKTLPVLEYGLSKEGSDLLKQANFWPIPDWEKLDMYTRLHSQFGLNLDMLRNHCGPQGQKLSIAGSTTVWPIASIWSRLYKLACDVDLTLEGGGSSAGAGRLCANMEKGEPVDIGNMSRDWKASEATKRPAEFIHDCVKGDESRSSFVIDIALDGLVVALPKNGAGYACIQTLGGLSMHQLRWIYSSYTDSELQDSGWDPSCLTNSDSDSDTHFWSEIDPRCASEEIVLLGDPRGDGTYSEFERAVLGDWENGETVSSTRLDGYTEGHGFDLLSSALHNHNSIVFISHHFFSQKTDLFWAAPLRWNGNEPVSPTVETIGNGTYPLSRRVSMNLLNNEHSLQNTVPFLMFGLMHSESVTSIGFVPMQGPALEEMKARLTAAPFEGGAHHDSSTDDDNIFSSTGAIVGFSVGAVCVLCVILGCLMQGCGKRK